MDNCLEVKKIAHEIITALKYFEKEKFGFESRTLTILPEVEQSNNEIIIPIITKNNKQIKISVSVNETV
jgi:hypothetical protein